MLTCGPSINDVMLVGGRGAVVQVCMTNNDEGSINKI